MALFLASDSLNSEFVLLAGADTGYGRGNDEKFYMRGTIKISIITLQLYLTLI